jgi:hypothetical protein
MGFNASVGGGASVSAELAVAGLALGIDKYVRTVRKHFVLRAPLRHLWPLFSHRPFLPYRCRPAYRGRRRASHSAAHLLWLGLGRCYHLGSCSRLTFKIRYLLNLLHFNTMNCYTHISSGLEPSLYARLYTRAADGKRPNSP